MDVAEVFDPVILGLRIYVEKNNYKAVQKKFVYIQDCSQKSYSWQGKARNILLCGNRKFLKIHLDNDLIYVY